MEDVNSSSSIVNDATKQKRSVAVAITDSTEIQQVTEAECQPFFVDLSTLRKNSLDHLRETGLLPAAAKQDSNNDDENENRIKICLVREKHYAYLSRVFLPTKQPLGRNLVSLDSSRPWMIYWTLHGSDLLQVVATPQDPTTQGEKKNETECGSDEDTTNGRTLLWDKVGDAALSAVVSTLKACWQPIEKISLPQHITLTDQDRALLDLSPRQGHDDNNHEDDDDMDTSSEDNGSGSNNINNTQQDYYMGGGFGGGPGQMAHAATTYAAVLSLCIVATSSPSRDYNKNNMAWDLLERIRKPLYAWFLSLQQPRGGFRMHHDGEIDVRASYTIFCIAKLLNLLTPTLASGMTIDFISSCQTYEGGFGGEPFTEAHGGYAYCAVAALQLVNQLNDTTIDMKALRGWLVRRQLGYEGGFSGRANKLVDGCYSFWQGGALTIVSAHYDNEYQSTATTTDDIWLPPSSSTSSSSSTGHSSPLSYSLLFDEPMLQRYILLCAQDVSGGLRDKPSKPRDFYHSCYNLSGLSLSQHSGFAASIGDISRNTKDYNQYQYGHPIHSKVAASHPCYNIRLERVPIILDYFQNVV